MQKQVRKSRGFTIVEVIVIVVIIGVIAAVITPRLLGRIGQSKQAAAESTAASLATAINLFRSEHDGAWDRSATIEILWEKPGSVADEEWDPYVNKLADLIDPWGKQFMLVVPGEVNIDFDIVSYGSDGQPGGDGDAKDIIKP